MDKIKIGGFFAGQTLIADETFFEWKGVYGKGFKVPRSAVQAVMVEKSGWGKATLKLVGAGTELAKVEGLPLTWAEQAQAWMMKRIGK